MSVILPTAPANFYLPTLNKIKDDLSATNGITKGQLTLLSEAPVDANLAWAEVGAGNKANPERGTLVVGQADINLIVGPVPSFEETTKEFGYKLEFSKVSDILVNISPSPSTDIVGFALIIGRDTFAEGSNDDVRYLAKIDDVTITTNGNSILRRVIGIRSINVDDGALIDLPQWNLIINYAEPIT